MNKPFPQRVIHLDFHTMPRVHDVGAETTRSGISSTVRVSLRTDGAMPRKVYLAPSRENLDFSVAGNYAKVSIPEVCGYQLVVFEM